jgi:uncharacterized protein YggE
MRLAAGVPIRHASAMKKLVLLALASLPLSALAQGGLPDKPYIYVEGRAEIEKPADMVTLRFELVARNPDQNRANQEVQTKANKVFALLKERRIADADVIASDIKSEPHFEKSEDSRKNDKIVGYSVTRTFAVNVRDVQAFATIIDDLLGIAGVELSVVEPGLTKEKEIRAEIFEKALGDARERAEKSLKPMAMKIDSVFAVSPVAFSQIRESIFGSGLNPEATTERVIVTGSYIPTGGPGGTRVPSQYRLAPLTVREGIHVIYLISPTK